MPSAANLKAAQEVVHSRSRAKRGLFRDASGGTKPPLSLRNAVMNNKGASRATVARIVKRLVAANAADFDELPSPAIGRPRMLTEEQDEAIVAFIIWMERSGLPASKGEIEDAANTLRLRRDPEAKPVSRMWYPRFREDHPELEKAFLKASEKSRESWEAGGLADLKEWFKQLTEAIANHRINASECWNADQAGVRVGILRERAQCLIVRTKKKTRAQVLSPSDRETCTIIGTGSAAGDTTPPWLIFKSLPTLGWAYLDGDPNMRFAQSESAFSNGDITVEWARRFNRHSWEKSASARRTGKSFEEWFGSAHIIQGFEKSGIFPPADKPAVTYLLKKQLKAKKAVDPAFASLLPLETRFQVASDTVKHMREGYHDILSSPTRAGLRQVSNVMNEAALLETTIKMYADDRRSRIEKQYYKRKRGKAAKPVGEYSLNVSLQEIRDQQEEFIGETHAKEEKRQIRSTRSILLREIERLKTEWRENKEVVVNGITKKLPFKKWLEHTGKDKDYLSMDTQRSQMTQLLNEKTDGFMIDTELPPQVRDSIRAANHAAKPLTR
ncbi:hypothetical protein FOFC_07530 [Fusarium oxysporum]|nr:hypothetical protein FOFC_07530 [Fusarium oxysporum]